ncbi:hypothetical protein BHM03_00033722 [Ensete ventricosum]|nr:hypothetical protein BHM03_00033722 [Ensete ventricosum]
MLGQMDGSPVSDPGSRLLEWWSSGREEAPQLGSGIGSCKEVGLGCLVVGSSIGEILVRDRCDRIGESPLWWRDPFLGIGLSHDSRALSSVRNLAQ